MTPHASFKTPGGEEMVVLPRRDYERLLEAQMAIEDGLAFDRAKARLADGEDELVPAEVMDRLLAGDNPIRVWRRHRGLSLGDLAAQAGLSVSYLSQLETGQRKGPVDMLQKIAIPLKVLLDDLV